MKFLISAITLLSLQAWSANYTDAAIEAGFRQQNGTVEGVGVDEKAKNGFQVGVSGAFPISDMFSFRTGLFYVEKPLEYEVGGASEDIRFTYFEVPATAMYKFAEYAGVYAGLNVDVNLSDDCGTTNCQSVQSLTTPFVMGAAFKFAPQLGANVFFESGSSKLADGVKDFRAVGVNLMVTVD